MLAKGLSYLCKHEHIIPQSVRKVLSLYDEYCPPRVINRSSPSSSFNQALDAPLSQMQFTALSMLLAGVSAYNGVRMVPHSSRVVMMSDAPAAVAEPAPVAEVAAPAAAPAPAPAAKPAAKKVEPEEPAPTPLDAALVEIIASKKRLIDAHNEDAQVRLSPA